MSFSSFFFFCKANGKLANCHDVECALLTWKHQYGNSKTVNMEYWSDASNDTYHNIYVFKNGYRPYHTTKVMDSEQTLTANLVKDTDNLDFSKHVGF